MGIGYWVLGQERELEYCSAKVRLVERQDKWRDNNANAYCTSTCMGNSVLVRVYGV
jgi:hypothetical protein